MNDLFVKNGVYTFEKIPKELCFVKPPFNSLLLDGMSLTASVYRSWFTSKCLQNIHLSEADKRKYPRADLTEVGQFSFVSQKEFLKVYPYYKFYHWSTDKNTPTQQHIVCFSADPTKEMAMTCTKTCNNRWKPYLLRLLSHRVTKFNLLLELSGNRVFLDK